MTLRRALPALWAALRSWILIGLATALVATASAMAIAALRTWLGDPIGPLQIFLAVLVFGTAIATPVALLSIRWFAALTVAVLEPGARPLRRSAALARGAYVRLGMVLSLAWLIGSLPLIALGFGQGAARVLLEDTWGTTLALAASALLQWLSTVLWTPFMAALQTVLYYDQRVRSEGFDVQLAVAALAPEGAAGTRATGPR